MIGVSNSKITKYITKIEAESEFVPKTDFDSSIIENILNSINILNNEVVDINTDITNINTEINTTNSNVSTNTINIENNSNDISDLSLQVNQNTTNISTNTNNISGLKTRMTTAEGNIQNNTRNISVIQTNVSTLSSTLNIIEGDVRTNTTNINTNTTEINNIKNQISSIPINPYEGLYTSIYAGIADRCMTQYNYNKGKMMYSKDSNNNWRAMINDVYGAYMDMSIKDLILPGIVKQISSSGTITDYVSNITYIIDSTTVQHRAVMPNLTTITTEANVYNISFDLAGAPNLRYFNLMEGLQMLKLSYPSFNENNKINLKVPSSVIECELTNITFTNLIIEDGPQDLKLTYKANHILGKFVCNRILTNTSSFTMTISGVTPAVKPPLILETNISLLKLLRSDYLGYCEQYIIGGDTIAYSLTTYTTLILNGKDIDYANKPSLPYTLKFRRIYNNTMFNYGDVSNLTTDHWIG